jgi:hypothetical protein
VDRLKEIQTREKLSDRALVDMYPDLTSARTWGRWKVAEWGASNPDRALMRLRRIIATLDGGTPLTERYPLPFYREFEARVNKIERATTDRRILVILAPNGTGKTVSARWLVERARAKRAYCRMWPAWRNKELHIICGILKVLGADNSATNAADAEQKLVSALTSIPITLFLDQAHEGGPALMHLLRMLVDETPCRFVYLGYDTAFRRVQAATTDTMIEARAFVGRCLKPIFDLYKHGTQPKDVAMYLMAEAGLSAAVSGSLAARITPVLQSNTNLRLLQDAITAARSASDDDEVAPDVLIQQVYGLAGLDPEPQRRSEEE